MAARIAAGTSWACAASSLRGRARKLIPNALTKHAAASPAVRASPARASANTRFSAGLRTLRFWSNAWNVSHSLTKPLRGGSPAMAAEPTRKHAAVHGMRLRAAHLLHVPRARRVQHAARAEEQERLERGWFTVW